MLAFLDKFSQATDFLAHGYCLVWDPVLLWLHVGSDIATGLSYFLIAAVLFYLVGKRRDLPYFWLFYLFAAFIAACGVTHFFAVWTIYVPSYWAEGMVKAVTALISISTALLLVPFLPKIMALPNLSRALEENRRLNRELESQLGFLRKSEARFRSLVEATQDGIVIGDEQGNILSVNRAAAEMFGHENGELKGQPLISLMPERYQARHLKGMANFIATGNSRYLGKPLSFWGRRRDGDEFPLELNISSWVAEGRINFGGIIRDVSERARLEEEKANLERQLRATQKMEAIGTLAGGIAHDFNNILVPIIAYTEIVAAKEAAGSENWQSLQAVLKAAHRAKELVKQILAFSREREHEAIPVQIVPLVKESLKLLQSSLPSTIEVVQQLEGDGGTILADPTQIHQVVMNLCTNAYYAMREQGGVLEVTLAEVKIGAGDSAGHDLAPGAYLVLSVSDTGAGMDPATMERIFDPYFTTRKFGEGTGLGLAMVHGIVKKYGGDIRVYSEPGQGASFQVYFPVVGKAEKGPDFIIGTLLAKGDERILLVDDELPIASSLQKMLEFHGYQVVMKTSSVEALAAFRLTPRDFDLVITDQTMPELTGEKLVLALKEIRPEIPVILCTGFSATIDEAKARDLGIDAFFMKPVLIKEITETIRSILDKTKVEDTSVVSRKP
ncbi:MAG: PAS domain S-box protein [Desulfurivibrionaceae bacterium]